MQLGKKFSEKQRSKAETGLSTHLHPGEQIQLLVQISKLSPSTDCLAVTDARLIAFSTLDVQTSGPKVVIYGNDLAHMEAKAKLGNPVLTVEAKSGTKHTLGQFRHTEDAILVRDAFVRLREAGTAEHVAQAAAEHVAASPEAWYDGVKVVGGQPPLKAHQALLGHAQAGERPWLVINGDRGGVLAAFDDRLMIAKFGIMAGAMGGGRVTLFAYTDVTGIEYNAGMLMGVLEVLTPSYQGTANHDFWSSGKNQDPYKLSNCVPLAKNMYGEALPHLNELRRRIAEAKKPTVHVVGASSPNTESLADQLGRLAAMRDQGILSEEEFADAKRAAIAAHRA